MCIRVPLEATWELAFEPDLSSFSDLYFIDKTTKMSAFGETAKPRRKLVTYGKASRMPLPGYQKLLSFEDSDNEDASSFGSLKPVSKAPKSSSDPPRAPESAFYATAQGDQEKARGKTSIVPDIRRAKLHAPVVTSDPQNEALRPDIFRFTSSAGEDGSRTVRTQGTTKRRKVRIEQSEKAPRMEHDSDASQSRSSDRARRLKASPEHQSPKKTTAEQSARATMSKSTDSQGQGPRQTNVYKSQSTARRGLGTTKGSPRQVGRDMPIKSSSTSSKSATVSISHSTPVSTSVVVDRLGEQWHQKNQKEIISNLNPEMIVSPESSDADNTSPSTPLQSHQGKKGSELLHSNKFVSPGGLDLPSLRISNTGTALARDKSLRSVEPSSNVQKRLKLVDKLNKGGQTGGNKGVRDGFDGIYSEEYPGSSTSNTSGDDDTDEKLQQMSTIVDASNTATTEPVAVIQPQGPKVTYAARNRTVLRDKEKDELEEFTLSQSLEPPKSFRRIEALLNPPTSQNSSGLSDDEDDLQGGHSNSMKSVRELREAGVNARVNREVEALLDDIESSSSISQQRAAILDLALRLQNPAFCEQLVISSLDSRLFASCGHGSDAIAKTLTMLAVLQVISTSSSALDLSRLRSYSVTSFLGKSIDDESDLMVLAKSRKSNLSKVAQQDIERLSKFVLNSNVWRFGSPSRLTTRVVALQCFEYLVRHLREAGSLQEIVSRGNLDRLVLLLSPRSPSVEASQPTPSEVQLSISILESSSVTYNTSGHDPSGSWSVPLLESVARFLPCIAQFPQDRVDEIWTLTLRLCLNLTNNDTKACDAFSAISYIQTVLNLVDTGFSSMSLQGTEEKQDLLLDNLILALGFLINLAERSKGTRATFARTNEPLDLLLRLFTSRLASAFEASSVVLREASS